MNESKSQRLTSTQWWRNRSNFKCREAVTTSCLLLLCISPPPSFRAIRYIHINDNDLLQRLNFLSPHEDEGREFILWKRYAFSAWSEYPTSRTSIPLTSLEGFPGLGSAVTLRDHPAVFSIQFSIRCCLYWPRDSCLSAPVTISCLSAPLVIIHL